MIAVLMREQSEEVDIGTRMALKEVLMASCMQTPRSQPRSQSQSQSQSQDSKLHAKDGPEIEQRLDLNLDLNLDLHLNLNLNLKIASCMQRTDQRSRKIQPGVQVKKATISEDLELRELE